MEDNVVNLNIDKILDNIKIIHQKQECLEDILLTLNIRHISSDTIKRSELLQIVNKSKTKYKDPKIDKVLDEVFDEYFVKEKKEVSISELEKMIKSDVNPESNVKSLNNESKDNNNNYSEGDIKGASKVLRTSYFKTDSNLKDAS